MKINGQYVLFKDLQNDWRNIIEKFINIKLIIMK